MDKIPDKVYLGDCIGAADEKKLKENNIKRVLSCIGHLSPKYNDKSIIQKIIELDDSREANIIQYFKDSIEFIEESDKVFVHCLVGVSRSPTFVIAYFMWKNRQSYNEAYEMVNKQRMIAPNLGFRKQLLIFEQKLKENNYDLDKIDFKAIVWPTKVGIK